MSIPYVNFAPSPPPGMPPGNEKILAAAAQQAADMRNMSMYDKRKSFFSIAKVISCSPTTGAYRIAVGGGQLNSYAVLATSGGNRIYGTKDVVNYSPGTDVVVFIPGEECDVLMLPVILGSCNVICLNPAVDHLFNQSYELVYKSGIAAYSRVDQKEQILGEDAYSTMQQNFSYGRPVDVVPGEWCQVNALTGGFLLNDFVSSIRMSDMASVECFGFDNSVRLKGEILSRGNAGFDERIFYDRYALSSIQGWASSLNEGMGGLNGYPALKDQGEKDPTQPRICSMLDPSRGQRGFFSYTSLQGYLADGEYSYYRVPGYEWNYWADDEYIIPATLSEEKRMDGAYRLRAAREISFEKTIYIPAPKERKDSDLQDTSGEKPFERVPWDKDHPPVSDISLFGRIALDDFNEHELLHNSLSGVDTKTGSKGYWHNMTFKEGVYNEFNEAYNGGIGRNGEGDFDPVFSLPALSDTDPHYVTDAREVTIKPFMNADGKRTDEVKLYDLSSSIKQLEDGSIVISGGYGEEIRFYRGNIYLSCPGDIIETPGRDKVTFAPRHNIQKACKGMLELTSDNSVAVAAAGNVQILAGASKKGTLLIENKSDSNIDVKAFQAGGSLSQNVGEYGGVVIRSKSMLGLISQHNFIGHSNGFAGSKTQICSETILGNVGNVSLNLEAGGIFNILGFSGGSLSFTGPTLELLCQNMDLGVGVVNLTSAKASTQASNRNGENFTVSIQSGPPSLRVKGAGSFTDLQAVSGNIDALATQSGDVSQQGGVHVPIGSYAQRTIPAVVGDLRAVSALQQLYDIFKDAMNNSLDNLKIISTVFPESSQYMSTGFFLPMSTWQAVLTGGKTWSEMKVSRSDGSYSMPFPGKDVWEGKGLKSYDVEASEIQEKSLATEYVVNTSMQKTGV